MKTRCAILLGIIMLVSTSAFAQETSRLEASVDFSYLHFVPQNNNLVQPFNAWGGGGSAVYYLLHHLGIKADLQGYATTTQNFRLAPGTAFCPTGCSGRAQANLFTYAFGPQFKFHMGRIAPFVEALGGGAHSNLFGNALRNCTGCTIVGRNPSNNAGLFIVGGGIDINLTSRIAVRAGEVDYVLTRFGSAFTFGNNNQSNIRYLGGMTFRF